MLESITLQFTENDDIHLPMNGVTIFVGPNNAGKSLILREIASLYADTDRKRMLLKEFSLHWPSSGEIDSTLEKMSIFSPSNVRAGYVILGGISLSGEQDYTQVNREELYYTAAGAANASWMARYYYRWGVTLLDGRSRFDLTSDRSAGDILRAPQNILTNLFVNDEVRRKVRQIIKDAFGMWFVIDPTNLGQMRIRLSRVKPPKDEQSLNVKMREFYKNALHIKETSDGVQAFTGIVTAVCSGEYHTVLVDEPEAFLHPPLARKLGKSLAALISERAATMVASTHSADFLLGCVQGSPAVRVVRLEFSDGKSRGRTLDPIRLKNFFRRPLIRSSNVISGLFHDGVVICESDNDRAFYAEIYYRLSNKIMNLPSILFVNAQNKHTIRDIMGPLREFGVPAAAISDIDIVTDGGQNWTNWMKAANIPEALHNGYGQLRSSIRSVFENSGRNMKTDGGVNCLDAQDRDAALRLFTDLEHYGIFPVPNGELESWLPHLRIPGKKTDWSVAALEMLGSDPADPAYVQPGEDDVWEFLNRIVRWIGDPTRSGMP
ncbi:ATP-dependent nuclease [Amaricoccus solimangrovi]|uniref:ATP-binding protein n=1 Tax=Amaricoccus solimangrovi TaxID=2589815 RepID=A0A501WZ09_9RHOB|nr:AAA family ATPase [Amaricoccus solimangrovi]TPE53594.1 ATP-binding protein [Amaricoccus solimangrovi]